MSQIWIYKFKQIPELSSAEAEGKTLNDFFDTQQALISNACCYLKQIGSFSIELRINNRPSERKIDTYLVICFSPFDKQNQSEAFHADFSLQLQSAFPKGYILQKVDPAAYSAVLIPSQSGKCQQIRRRLDLIAVGNFFGQYNGQKKLSPLRASLPNSIPVAMQHRNRMSGQDSLTGWAAKDNLEQMEGFSVPSLPHLIESRRNWSRFFNQLVLTKSFVQLRIAITTHQLVEKQRLMASEYYKELLNSPLSSHHRSQEEQAQLDGLAKYFRHDWLYQASIELIGSSDTATGILAGMLAKEIGGMAMESSIKASGTGSHWANCSLDFSQLDFDQFNFMNTHEKQFLQEGMHLYTENEITNIMRFPVAIDMGLAGSKSKIIPNFDMNINNCDSYKPLQIGSLVSSATTLDNNQSEISHPSTIYSIPLASMAKHVLISGVPGSGKTNTTMLLVKRLLEHKVPCLIIEPVKSEYYDMLRPIFEQNGKPLQHFQFERPFKADGNLDKSFLRFNPLVPLKGITLHKHISFIKTAFMAAAPMEGIVPVIFDDFFNNFYAQFTGGDRKKMSDENFTPMHDDGRAPSVADFNAFAKTYFEDPERFNKAKSNLELIQIFQRRIIRFSTGLLGEIFKPENCFETGEENLMAQNMQTLLYGNSVVDLDGIGDDNDKAMLIAFILVYLYQDRSKRKSHDPANQPSVLFLEEAHRLMGVKATSGNRAASESAGGAETTATMFNNFLAESRAKAQGIVIIEQMPSKLSADAVKNTGTKIHHRITSEEDRLYMGGAMAMSEEQMAYTAMLKSGEAVVYDDTLDKPILIKVDLI